MDELIIRESDNKTRFMMNQITVDGIYGSRYNFEWPQSMFELKEDGLHFSGSVWIDDEGLEWIDDSKFEGGVYWSSEYRPIPYRLGTINERNWIENGIVSTI